MRTKDQQNAFDKLNKLKCGALFMRMGTGKTKVALDLISSKIHKVDTVLWICPCALKNEIEAERLKWHPELELTIIGVESISQSDRTYMEVLSLVSSKQVFCVVDESLKIKNMSAKRTRRMLEIGSKCAYRLILNGTPISKGAMDLWAQMSFLSPKILKMDYRTFKRNYVIFSDRPPRYIRGYQNLDHLTKIIAPYVYDADLDIDVRQKYRVVLYQNDLKSEYAAIKEEILLRFKPDGEDNDFDFYELCSRLQRCYTKSPSKQETISWVLKEISDEQAIVFVRYLDSIPASANCITGAHKLAERKAILSDFKVGKFKVLYITYGVGAYGLNLQFCHNVIFAEHMFDYAAKIQAEARVYRMGQDKDVTYWDIVCNCGMEDLIINCINKKSNLLDEVNRLINKVGIKEWLKTI